MSLRDGIESAGLVDDQPHISENTLNQNRAAFERAYFSVAAVLIDTFSIMASALVIGWVYHLIAFGESPINENLFQIGAVIALFTIIPNIVRHEYSIGNFLTFNGHTLRSFHLWNLAFAAAIILGFLTKTSLIFSRGTVVLFYSWGFLALILGRYLMVRFVKRSSKTGTIAARRIFLFGFEDEVMTFATKHQPWNLGMQIIGTAVLPKTMDEKDPAFVVKLEDALKRARQGAADDVFILMGWQRKNLIDNAIDRFLTIPASIHLGVEPALERFHDVRVARIGTVSSLQIVRNPLSLGDVMLKRLFDLVCASIGLVLLLPFFAFIALAIKLDSSGPAFFMQRRYGFNQLPFKIFKFRTMLTMDDGAIIQQAAKNDPRITRVGQFLRRWNLDELPQLLNVIRGDMSLVGPRPHALAHDHIYEHRIALYARRHNVKPGITGWAQVNGLRGETTTEGKMLGRVSHDLHYIDNWSIWFDMMIIVQTVFSSKAYRNAV